MGEISKLGEIETSSSELLISFKSDCDVTNKGFQAVVQFVEKSIESNEVLETKVKQSKTEDTYNELVTTRGRNSNKEATYPQTSTTSYPLTIQDLDETKTKSLPVLRTTSFGTTTQQINLTDIQLEGNFKKQVLNYHQILANALLIFKSPTFNCIFLKFYEKEAFNLKF